MKFAPPPATLADEPVSFNIEPDASEITVSPELIGVLMGRYARRGHTEGDVILRLPVRDFIDFLEALGFRRVSE